MIPDTGPCTRVIFGTNEAYIVLQMSVRGSLIFFRALNRMSRLLNRKLTNKITCLVANSNKPNDTSKDHIIKTIVTSTRVMNNFSCPPPGGKSLFYCVQY